MATNIFDKFSRYQLALDTHLIFAFAVKSIIITLSKRWIKHQELNIQSNP
jgi:hypothetical protein